MDNDVGQKFSGKHSMCGAIFMSNRKTKQECLRRKLFGLPANQAGFLKKVKAGMLLFLFEHEERKLYGVFEATSDGALNIVPDAFISSGMSFPAQIHFKRIWMCKPLFEDEFRDAIKGNYYSSQKFNFGLSYEQVSSLVRMFSSKKIHLEPNRNPGTPNEVIQAYKSSSCGGVGVPSKDRYKGIHSDEFDTDNDIDSSSHSANFPRYIGQSVYDNSRKLRSGNSSPYNALPDHHVVQGSGHELGSVALDNHPSMAQEPPVYSGSNVNSIDQRHPSQSNAKFTLPSNNDQSPGVSRSHKIYRESSCRTVPSQDSLPFRSSVVHANPPDYEDTSFLGSNFSCHATPTPGIVKHRRTGSPSMNSPLQKEIFRGHRLNIKSSSLYSPLSPEDGLLETRESSHIPNIPPKYEFGSKSRCNSEFVEENEDVKSNQALHDECSPMADLVNSKLHSDTDQRRTSAFSRLSNVREPPHDVYSKQHKGPSQLLETLSDKSDRWNENARVKTTPDNQIVNKAFPDTSGIEQSDLAALLSSEMFTEEEAELPFTNFKRRNIHKLVDETERRHFSGEDKVKHKRRRLVRPFFSEEECQRVHDSSQVVAQHDVAMNSHSQHKTQSYEMVDLSGYKGCCETTLGHVGTAISVDDRHLDSILAQVNASPTVPKGQEQKTNNASETASHSEAFFRLALSGAGAQVSDQHGAEKNAQISPPKTKSDDYVDASYKSSFDATLGDVGAVISIGSQGSRSGDIVDLSGGLCDASLGSVGTATLANVTQSLKSSESGVSVATPTRVHLKSIVAQTKPSGEVSAGKEQTSNASEYVNCESPLLPVHSGTVASDFSVCDPSYHAQKCPPKTSSDVGLNASLDYVGTDTSADDMSNNAQNNPPKTKSDGIADSTHTHRSNFDATLGNVGAATYGDDTDNKSQIGPSETKSDAVAASSEVFSQHDVGNNAPKTKTDGISDSTNDVTLGNVDTAASANDSEGLKSCRKGDLDKTPIWLRLKSIVAQAKHSGK